MAYLTQAEYDVRYYDGNLADYRHNAGYSIYERGTEINGFDRFGYLSTDILNRYAVGNKQVLVIGSAKGYLVEDLRSLGIDAYGIDWSQYAYDEASPSVQPFLTVGDIKTILPTYNRNQWDLVISRDTLSCFSPTELNDLVPELNRISRKQFHKISELSNANFYTSKTLQQWVDDFAWSKGTIIASKVDQIETNFVVK